MPPPPKPGDGQSGNRPTDLQRLEVGVNPDDWPAPQKPHWRQRLKGISRAFAWLARHGESRGVIYHNEHNAYLVEEIVHLLNKRPETPLGKWVEVKRNGRYARSNHRLRQTIDEREFMAM